MKVLMTTKGFLEVTVTTSKLIVTCPKCFFLYHKKLPFTEQLVLLHLRHCVHALIHSDIHVYLILFN